MLGVVTCPKGQGFLLRESRVLLDGSRTPHSERLESTVVRMDAWAPHLAFPWARSDKAGSICCLWGRDAGGGALS